MDKTFTLALTDALGPWPILQLFFGTAVLGIGVYAMIRGLASSRKSDDTDIEDKRHQWEAYQRLENIERYTQHIAENQKVMLDRVNQCTEAMKQVATSINSLASAIWNKGV